MLSRRSLLAVAALMLASPPAGAADDPLDGLLARIARARAPLRTLQGPFTQTRTLALLSTDVRSTGTLALVRPDRLRWELAPPDAVTFFVGPEGLAYRSPHGQGRMPAGGGGIARALDDLRTLLGGDLGRLRERWDMRVVRDDAGGAEIDAVARQGIASSLRGFRFALTPDLVRPTHAVLVDGPHDRTVVEFGTLVVDHPIDLARMRP
ncbi:MAG: outer membrane lipoprotein carrier protein LolA [Polyangiaceae bacterium]